MASNIASILSRMKTVAFVGLSKDPAKYSHEVAHYFREKGIEVIPVNPTVDQIMGLKSYPSLSAIPDQTKKRIDVVDIFRRPEDVPPIVDEAIALKKFSNRPIVVWMQLGIVNEEAAEKAREAGLEVVMDACIRIEHRKRYS